MNPPVTRRHDSMAGTATPAEIAMLCERLLGRALTPQDGIEAARLEAAERHLGRSIPAALHALYALAGRVECLLESFQRFADPEQLEIEDGKLVFLEENQSVCHWATSIETAEVFLRPDGESQWYPEGMALAEFLRVILYYQCAEGGYPHVAMVGLDGEALRPLLAAGWEKVVEHNGLHIHWRPDCLLWWLQSTDDNVDCVFLSARTQEAHDDHAATYCLEAL